MLGVASCPSREFRFAGATQARSVKITEGCAGLSVRMSAAWEEESPGRSPKSLKKISKKSGPSGPKSLKNSLEESPKSLAKKTRFWTLSRLSDPPRDFFQTLGARGSENFFETSFRLLGLRPGDSSSQVAEILY